MPHIINHQLTEVNFRLMDAGKTASDNVSMIEKQSGLAERFEQLRSGMTYQALSDAILRKTGVRISAQAMHKWSKGGKIDEINANAVATFFGVKPLWLMFGVGEQSSATIDDAIQALPTPAKQQVLDFIQYKIEKSDGAIAGEKLAHYMKMIDSIRTDMDKKNGKM